MRGAVSRRLSAPLRTLSGTALRHKLAGSVFSFVRETFSFLRETWQKPSANVDVAV
jgi:hypothetical protein